MKRLTNAFVFIVSCLLCLPLQAYGAENNTQSMRQAYANKVDREYVRNLTKSLEEFKSNPKLGYRTAGSKAEIQTAKKLFEEMKRIGLADVKMEEFTLDGWEFTKADLTFTDAQGAKHTAVLGGYPSQFDTKGKKTFKVVYGGRGTAEDLENLDVKGKLVLIDINQREEWWISYPAYQAKVKGAAAVLAMQNGGYGEISPDALNSQDMCGPADAPAFSISQTDAKKLKEVLTKADNEVKVTFDAKSVVMPATKAYNVTGKIIGKNPESLVLLSAHFDSYFSGFQDDNVAIGLMFGIAKGLIDSNYTPEKTIIVNALAAEEWGVINSRYDWSTGAYNQIFRLHPEWAGKAIVDMNFEMPAYQHETTDKVRVVQEYVPFLKKFITSLPRVIGAYPDGVAVISPVRTWSDDFSFAIAGVPSMRNDFEEGIFRKAYYHSNFDTEATYNKDVLMHHLYMYGLMTIAYDRVAVAPLDFTLRLQEIKKSIAAQKKLVAPTQVKQYVAKVDKALALAHLLAGKVNVLNAAYSKALEAGNAEKAQSIYTATRALNSKQLAVFKLLQDEFVRLTWEDEPIFAHTHAVNNLTALHNAINALEKGDIPAALDSYIAKVDNTWYAFSFDKEVFNYFTDYVLQQPADRLMWGAGRIVGHENLFDVVKSLQAKQKNKQTDVEQELTVLRKAVVNQQQLLVQAVQNESAALDAIIGLLQETITAAKN